MKKQYFLTLLSIIFFANSTIGQTTSNFHKVKVKQIKQVNSYTYILVEEGTKTKWLAAPRFEPKIDGIYYYKGGMKMTNFKSKELNKTFDEVYFISKIYDNPFDQKNKTTYQHKNDLGKNSKNESSSKKITLDLKREPGILSIAELYKNMESYSGKTIKVKGKVTKYNAQVMSKNWIHLQDGTEYNNNYDLTVTSKDEVNIGDIVILEGLVSVNKDFGYGYKYNLIIENAVLVK